jgi:hypothetical protein
LFTTVKQALPLTAAQAPSIIVAAPESWLHRHRRELVFRATTTSKLPKWLRGFYYRPITGRDSDRDENGAQLSEIFG